jgi:hypothetical protein
MASFSAMPFWAMSLIVYLPAVIVTPFGPICGSVPFTIRLASTARIAPAPAMTSTARVD